MKDAICGISSCLCLLHLCRLKTVVSVTAEPLQLMNFFFFFFFTGMTHIIVQRATHFQSQGYFCLAPALKTCLQEKVVGPQYPKADVLMNS